MIILGARKEAGLKEEFLMREKEKRGTDEFAGHRALLVFLDDSIQANLGEEQEKDRSHAAAWKHRGRNSNYSPFESRLQRGVLSHPVTIGYQTPCVYFLYEDTYFIWIHHIVFRIAQEWLVSTFILSIDHSEDKNSLYPEWIITLWKWVYIFLLLFLFTLYAEGKAAKENVFLQLTLKSQSSWCS